MKVAESTQEYLRRFDTEIRKMIMANGVIICDNKITGLVGDYVSLNIEEIINWITQNCKGGARYEGLAMLYTIEFDNNEDIPLFTLRWL